MLPFAKPSSHPHHYYIPFTLLAPSQLGLVSLPGNLALYSLTIPKVISVLTCHSSMSFFPEIKLYRGSLEELYLSQDPQVASGRPLRSPHKMCKSIGMANVKACSLKSFREEPRERPLSQDCWMPEASAAAVVSYRAFSEHGSELDLQPALQRGPTASLP